MDNVTAPVMKFDSFKVEGVAKHIPAYPVKTGAAIYTGSGYLMHDNVFVQASASTLANIGVLAYNTGSNQNLVHNNSYYDMGTGNLSNFKNTNGSTINPKGLQFTCNNHSGNLTDEGARGADSVNDGVSSWQGNSSVSAGNTFGGGTNVYNPGNEVNDITYFYHGTSPSSYGSVTLTSASTSNTCAEVAEPDDNSTPTDTHFGGQIGTTVRVLHLGHLTHPRLNDTTLDHPLSGSTHLGRQQVYYNINYYLNDSLGMQNTDSLKFWLMQAQTPYTDLAYDQLLIDLGADSSEVYYGYDSIRYWYALDSVETREYLWGRKLMGLKLAMRSSSISTPMAVYQPDSTQVALLEQVADSANMWARIMAQDWLRAYDGRTFDNPVLYPETGYDSTGGKPGQPNENLIGNVANATRQIDKLYPNPVHDLLYVSYVSPDGGAGMMTISDVTGRIVLQKELKAQDKPTILNLSGLKAGIYFYRISEGGKITVQGKVAKD